MENKIQKWKIYAGLSGGFGGANFIKTFAGSRERAESEAYQEAVEIYESYVGTGGLRTEEEIEEEEGVDYDEAKEIYNEEMEGWLDYYVEPYNGVDEKMKHIRLFEEFNNISERALLPYNMKDLYNKISLYKMADRIYAIVIPEQQLRAMVFLRFQEFYESSSDEFQGKKFKWDRYIQWYKSPEGPMGEREAFTYGKDWSGFNLPSEAIEKCLEDIDDHNKYDDIMISIMSEIRKEEKENFYLIAVDEMNVDSGLLDHEMAHGFYYTDPEYKSAMINLINLLPAEPRKNISDIIIDYGYSESVLNDEIQAYMSTGLASKMDKDLNNHTSEFKKNFDKFKRIHHAVPVKMNVNYENS